MRKIGAIGLAFTLIACGKFGHDEEAVTPAPVDQPSQASPTSDSGAGNATSDAGAGITTPPAPMTCQDLKALVPRAKLDAEDVGASSLAPITAVDMYAYEVSDATSRTLALVITEQPDPCAIRRSHLRPAQSNEVIFSLERTAQDAPAFGVGTYFTDEAKNPDITISFDQQTGSVCDDGGPGGQAWAGTSVIGFVAIDSRTDTEIAGTINLTSGDGKKTKVAFTAPICNEATTGGVCCGP